jgi:tRNA threonylcarbamoyladenosine biosynthesis protein TsaB
MLLLGLETSGQVASVAVCDEDGVISQTSVLAKRTHSQVIMPLMTYVLSNASLTLEKIDGFAVSSGPGSYTGLRIGIAAVKAVCFALDKTCAGISALESLAYNMRGFRGYIRPVMAARGELVYTALFKSDGDIISRLSADAILPLSDAAAETAALDGYVVVNGDGAAAFCERAADGGRVKIAPPPARLQTAQSLCYACFAKGAVILAAPDRLNAEYMEATKAEKDLG